MPPVIELHRTKSQGDDPDEHAFDLMALQPFIRFIRNGINKRRKATSIAINSKFRIIWGILRVLFLLYFISVIPYRFCMNISQGGFSYTIVVDWIADLFFYVDMYLTARKFVHPDEEGELIYHRTEICRIYRRSGRFWRDLVALLPADVVVAICIWFNISLSWDIVYGLRLIRLILAFTLFERFPIAIGTQSARVLRQLLKLIVANVLVIHVGGCFWHLLRAGVGETGLPLNPSLASGSAPRHWKDFVLSAYYIMCLVTSIGYGDVIPYGNWTLMYSMAFMIFGFITKGLVVAYLVAMLKNYVSSA